MSGRSRRSPAVAAARAARDRGRAGRGEPVVRDAEAVELRVERSRLAVVEAEEARRRCPRSRRAGSSVSRWRSEPPTPRRRWTCSDLHASALLLRRRAATAAGSSHEGDCRRDAEEEVPRHAVADGAGEDHRHDRPVAEEEQREREEPPRQPREPDERRGRTSAIMKTGSHDVPGEAAQPRLGRVALDRDDRAPEHPDGLRGELRLLARVLAPEVAHLALGRSRICAHSSTVDRPCRLAGQVGGELGPGWRARQLGHLVDPLAVARGSRRSRGCSPSRARGRRSSARSSRPRRWLRTTHGVTTSAATPTQDGTGERRRGPAAGDPSATKTASTSGSRSETRVREDREPGDEPRAGCGWRACSARPRRRRASVSPAASEPVEDLAVDVDVVPDEVRVQGRERRRRRRRPAARRPASRSRRRAARCRPRAAVWSERDPRASSRPTTQ